MKSTKVQRFMLFTLGRWFEEANEKIKDKPLEVSISKSAFIGMIKNTGFAKKQERAVYKNLEILEKKKLVVYKNKELELTEKGKKLFEEVKKEVMPYLYVFIRLKEKNPVSYTKKVQTVFR